MKNFFINLTIATVVAMSVFLIGFSAGLVRYQYATTTPPQVNSTAVSLLLNDGNKISSYTNLPIVNGATVLSILELTAEQERFALEVNSSTSLGAFIKKIGDKTNGQNKRYWQYWVNGTQPQVAADKYILQGGETVLWSFSDSEY